MIGLLVAEDAVVIVAWRSGPIGGVIAESWLRYVLMGMYGMLKMLCDIVEQLQIGMLEIYATDVMYSEIADDGMGWLHNFLDDARTRLSTSSVFAALAATVACSSLNQPYSHQNN